MITKDIDKILSDLNKCIQDLKEQNNIYLNQIKQFNESEEIKALNDKIQNLYIHSIAILNDGQKKLCEKFRNKHYKRCKGNVEYIISGTGIGDIVKLRCTKCGEIEDITDFNEW